MAEDVRRRGMLRNGEDVLGRIRIFLVNKGFGINSDLSLNLTYFPPRGSIVTNFTTCPLSFSTLFAVA